MIFENNKVYDVLKYIAMIALPAISTFYTLLSETWGLPHGPEITATINGVGTLLGALLVISSSQYNKSIKSK